MEVEDQLKVEVKREVKVEVVVKAGEADRKVDTRAGVGVEGR